MRWKNRKKQLEAELLKLTAAYPLRTKAVQ
jgi:hypothetical protein